MQQSLIPSNPSHFSGQASSEFDSLRKTLSLFRDAIIGFPAKWRLRKERRNSILMTRYQPDLGSVLLIGWSKLSAKKNHYPDVDSVASSVLNFCARFSDVIFAGSQCWRREITAFFSGYKFGGEMRGGRNNPLSSPLDRSRKSRYAWQTTVETRARDL